MSAEPTFKPHDVVSPKHEDYFMPGRVWKILNDGRVLVICCGLHITIYEPDDLELTDYKGRWLTYPGALRDRYPVWLRMTTLRKLKQRASGYHPDVWERKRPKGSLPRHTSTYQRRVLSPSPAVTEGSL